MVVHSVKKCCLLTQELKMLRNTIDSNQSITNGPSNPATPIANIQLIPITNNGTS